MINIHITLKDNIGLPMAGDYIQPGDPVTTEYDWEVPQDWFVDGELTKDGRVQLLKRMYGENWATGNPDGSKYFVYKLDATVKSA